MLRNFLLVLLLCFGALIIRDLARHAPVTSTPGSARPPDSSAAAPPATVAPRPIPVQVGGEIALAAETPALDMIARLAVRRRLAREGNLVYLDSMLAHTDSVLTRWPDRREVRVVLIFDTTMAGWNPALLNEARAGLHAWDENASGVTLRETATTDSADITLRWVNFLPDSGQVGSTTLTWGVDGVVRSATITLALRRNTDSLPVPPAVRRRVAVHEFGHALGLPHSDSDNDAMFRTSPVDEPSSRDQATLRLLYAVLMGPLKVHP